MRKVGVAFFQIEFEKGETQNRKCDLGFLYLQNVKVKFSFE